ncbi:hypothetical protein KC852_01595 [Candidatus Nomurabacteria bacterium]|nr:hypothetical protein [Candidatus Nomurabacteria bacterium]
MYAVEVKIFGKQRSMSFTYHHHEPIKRGSVVSVTIRGKKVKALVIDIKNIKDVKADIKNLNFKLKPIEKIFFEETVADTFFEVCSMLADFYALNESQIIDTFYPNILLETEPVVLEKKKNTTASKYVMSDTLETRINEYKTMIRESFAKKKNILFVLPSATEAEFFQKELSAGVLRYSYILHSSLTKKKQKEVLDEIKNKEHPFILFTTAKYISIFQNMDTVVMELEMSSNYFSMPENIIDKRVFVENYCALTDTDLIISDTSLRVETYSRYILGELLPYTSKSINHKIFENISIIDATTDKKEGEDFLPVSRETLDMLEEKQEKKHNLIFTLKKGLATQIICNDCGTIVLCPNCSSPYILREKSGKREFYCNRCSKEEDALRKCDTCDSWNLKSYGIGIDGVNKQLKKVEWLRNFHFVKEHLSTSALEKIQKKEGSNILAGFEIFGQSDISFDNTFIISIDSLLSLPSYDNSEKVISLIAKLSLLTNKNIFLQTRLGSHPLVKALGNNKLFSEWYKDEMDKRLKYNYPPFYRIINISYTSDTKRISIFKNKVLEDLTEYQASTIMRKISSDKYNINVVLKISDVVWPKYKAKHIKYNESLLNLMRLYRELGAEVHMDK